MMNPYQAIILLTLLVRYALSIGEWVSARRADVELPEEVRDVYDAEKYHKSRDYLNTATGFRVISETFSLVVLLLFWFFGGFNILDQIVRGWGLHPILTGILYIGILSGAGFVLNLPSDIFSTFVIEELFGFNRTKLRVFITDRLKGLALVSLLGIPFLALVLWFFDRMGSSAWIYCWLISIVISFLLQFITPAWILPLFNKYTPLPDGDLKDAIAAYAREVRFAFKEIFVVDSSKRSSKTNAFFTGFGRNKRIALFDTLVTGSTVPEIVAILAHEVGHYKRKHIIAGIFLGFLNSGLIFFLLSLFIGNRGLFDGFYMQDVSNYAGLLFFAMLYEPISFLLSIPFNALSRHNERQADRYAVETI
ncbi:MAG TPA: M48 family metallopeptidase, partial [Acidobacteriota bacterium]|nr:M48 family metallopeptidase [Acidobacteriota bacterium]